MTEINFTEDQKKDEWKVPGCQSQVWIIPTFSNHSVTFIGDSDAIIVRGIIAVVLEIFKDKTAQEILSIDVEKIFDKLGLREHITRAGLDLRFYNPRTIIRNFYCSIFCF